MLDAFDFDTGSDMHPSQALARIGSDVGMDEFDLIADPEDDGDKEEPTPDELAKIEEEMSAEGPQLNTGNDYLNAIGKVALLTREDEQRLALEIRAGKQAAVLLFELPPPPESPEKSTMTPGEIADLDPHRIERRRLTRVIQKGKEAKNQFIEANLRLVVNRAKRYIGGRVEFLDLIQEGNLGLIRAVEKFNPDRGFKFCTYAIWWIRQSITRSVQETGHIVRIPVHHFGHIRKMSNAEQALMQELNRDPTIEETVQEMNQRDGIAREKKARLEIGEDASDEQMEAYIRSQVIEKIRTSYKANGKAGRVPTEDEIKRYMQRWIWTTEDVQRLKAEKIALGPVSMSTVIGGDGNSTLEDFMASPQDLQDEDEARKRLVLRVRAAIVNLRPREEKIIRKRFGIPDKQQMAQDMTLESDSQIAGGEIVSGYDKDMTLEEVGATMDLTRERIRQLEAVAKGRLESCLNLNSEDLG